MLVPLLYVLYKLVYATIEAFFASDSSTLCFGGDSGIFHRCRYEQLPAALDVFCNTADCALPTPFSVQLSSVKSVYR